MKKELVRRIDLRSNGGGTVTGGGSGTTLIIGNGNADKLDGYDASPLGRPNTIPVLDSQGLIPSFMLPGSIEVISNISGTEKGARYIGPTAWLVTPLAVDGNPSGYVDVNGWIGDGNEWAVIQHYSVPDEIIRLAGASATTGANRFRYPILRGMRGTTPQAFPAGAKIVNLGKKDRGGYLVENAGNGLYAPYLDVWINNPDDPDNPIFGSRQGNLAGLAISENPSIVAFRALFPDADWNKHGTATGDIYLSGYINAKGGHIAGDLDVTGTFSVHDPNTPARLVVGSTPAGFGLTLQNQERRPVFSLAAAYFDEESQTYDGDTLWVVESMQQRTIWLHRVSDAWMLQIGPFNYTSTGMMSTQVDEFGDSYCMIAPQIPYIKFPGVDIDVHTVQITHPLNLIGVNLNVSGAESIALGATKIGLWGAEPVMRPSVSGDRSDGTAFVNLLAALESMGLIDDVTVA